MTRFIIYKDLEILLQSMFTWASNDRYSSSRIPRSLKDFVTLLLEILSMLKILLWMFAVPISLLLKTTFKWSSFTGFPWERNIIYFVFEVFTAILFARNQLATFCSSVFTNSIKILRFWCLDRHEPSSANREVNREVHRWKSLM